MVFPQTLQQIQSVLKPDAALLIKGSVRHDENSRPKVVVSEAKPLDAAVERQEAAFAYPNQSGGCFRRTAGRTRGSAALHPGHNPVLFELERPGDFRALMKPQDPSVVDASEELLAGLRGLLGEQSVTVEKAQRRCKPDIKRVRIPSAAPTGGHFLMTKPSGQQSVVQALEKQISELKRQPDPVAREEIERLQEQVDTLRSGSEKGNKDAWSRVLLARHPQRPYTLDYIQMLFTDFTELHGDRRFGDDGAMVGGFARFEGRAVMVVGHQKGRDTKQKLHRNFGMTNPEGYRKACA